MSSCGQTESYPVNNWSSFLSSNEAINRPAKSAGFIEFYPELYFRPGVLRNLWENDEASTMSKKALRRTVHLMIQNREEYDDVDLVYLVSGLYFNRGKSFTQDILKDILPAERVLEELEIFAKEMNVVGDAVPSLENVLWNPKTGEVRVEEDDAPLTSLFADELESALDSSSFVSILAPVYR
jgi:hypothetical protein